MFILRIGQFSLRASSAICLALLLSLSLPCASRAQQGEPSRDDILRGELSPARACYDVKTYDLDIRIDPSARSIAGSNTITFDVVEPFEVMQVDLFKNMNVDGITLDSDEAATVTREENSLFIRLPRTLEKGSRHAIEIEYSGNPMIAQRPPWSGGFTWAKDDDGHPWVVVTCQGTGASLWWPNKDHPADEPDSMKLSVTVPSDLIEVSNGRLKSKTEVEDGWTRYDWEISYSINNYCVTINIGKYAHFSDEYVSEDGEVLTLDYYVLPKNLETAKKHFEQTKPMLAAFEKYFGKYPYYRDGFKLIECPHPGMEHQSAIAYGNGFQGGYLGRASSNVGRKFDFIIVHEAAHEWWGNSVTMSDNADLWIHESFGAYAESLYVEEIYGYEDALEYINGKKRSIGNRSPIIGPYNVNRSGSGDMYNKGQLALNTLRHVLDDDELWFSILRGLQDTYKYQNVNAEIVIDFICETADRDLNYFFDQYFRHADIPELQLELTEAEDSLQVRYRWQADVDGFRMPVKVTKRAGEFEFIHPTAEWKTLQLEGMKASDFQVAEQLFYIKVTR